MAEDILLKVMVNGEVVAEAPLHVYDAPLAWEAFQDAYSQMAHLIAGEMFQSMRAACNPRLRDLLGTQGIIIDIAAPQLREVASAYAN